MPIPISAADLNVSEQVRQRGKDIYIPDSGEEAKPKQKAKNLASNYASTVIKSIPGIGQPLGIIYDGARGLDPNLNLEALTGAKERKINEILKTPGLEKGYNSTTNKYEALGQRGRWVDNVTDDDITDALLRRNHAELLNSDEYRDLTKGGSEGAKIRKAIKNNITTSGTDVQRSSEDINSRVELRESIKDMEGGVTALSDMGELPGADQLRLIQERLKPLQKKEIRLQNAEDRANAESTSRIKVQEGTLANQEQQTKDTREYNLGMLGETQKSTELARVKQINEQRLAEYDYTDKNDARTHEAEQLAAKLAHEASENDATRGIKMQIEMLGREDNREERAYDRRRDERQDRQMMIMQMMKGLQNFGSAFAL